MTLCPCRASRVFELENPLHLTKASRRWGVSAQKRSVVATSMLHTEPRFPRPMQMLQSGSSLRASHSENAGDIFRGESNY